jgi:hypothetical protein
MHGYMVYWYNIYDEYTGNDIPRACSKRFDMSELTVALAYMEDLRKNPNNQFVTMVSQNPDHVGKPGASSILPEDYQWSKQYRGARDLDEPRSLISPKATR